MIFIETRASKAIASFLLFITFAPTSWAQQVDDGQDGQFVMAALGDSITKGCNARLPFNNKSLSWAMGHKVNSHYSRIQQMYNGPMLKFDQAKIQANSSHLAGQMDELAKNLDGRELDYLTVMIGANDLCWWPNDHQASLESFQSNVQTALERAVSLNPKVKITLVPVPDMLRLYEVRKDKKSCMLLWTKLHICDGLFRARDEQDLQAFGERLRDLNTSLSNLADTYPDNVHYAEKVATAQFESEDVSRIDCFHPSASGQSNIAEDSWVGGWYDR